MIELIIEIIDFIKAGVFFFGGGAMYLPEWYFGLVGEEALDGGVHVLAPLEMDLKRLLIVHIQRCFC